VSDELWHAAQRARLGRSDRHERDSLGRIVRTKIGASARRKRLLAGFLECAECGGSFHAMGSRAVWCCSYRRNRGTCSNPVQIQQAKLEAAVLGAVRSALDEEVAKHALEVALDELRRRMQSAEPRALEAQVADLDAKIGRALDLAIELGNMEAAKRRLRALRDERERVAGQLSHVATELPSVNELCPAYAKSWPTSRQRFAQTLHRVGSRSGRSSA
jgi:hypothetical protein